MRNRCMTVACMYAFETRPGFRFPILLSAARQPEGIAEGFAQHVTQTHKTDRERRTEGGISLSLSPPPSLPTYLPPASSFAQ
jgi:hypothetical protein